MDDYKGAPRDRGEQPRSDDEGRSDAERAWRLARALYPANPGIPHVADFIPARR
jgi:hypothetical protein